MKTDDNALVYKMVLLPQNCTNIYTLMRGGVAYRPHLRGPLPALPKSISKVSGPSGLVPWSGSCWLQVYQTAVKYTALSVLTADNYLTWVSKIVYCLIYQPGT